MSTRCLIGKKYKDGSVKYIYCHYDGYLSYAGKKLNDFYNDNNIEQLLDLGDLSSLGNNPVSDKNAWKHPNALTNDEMCISYKDRGENTPAHFVNSEQEFINLDLGQDYSYILDNNEWYVYDYYFDENTPKLRSAVKDLVN